MSLVECGVARLVLPGQTESGDRHLVSCNQNSVLIAAIDGIGHGENAASAAKTAVSVLETGVQEPVISLVERCHERLRGSRGVVLSLAYVDMSHGMMTWLGVGNVQGVLLRAKARRGTMQEVLLLRGGVEHQLRGGPDVHAGAVALDKGNDGIVGNSKYA